MLHSVSLKKLLNGKEVSHFSQQQKGKKTFWEGGSANNAFFHFLLPQGDEGEEPKKYFLNLNFSSSRSERKSEKSKGKEQCQMKTKVFSQAAAKESV